MAHGKHRKQTSSKRRNLAIAISVATAGIAAPVVLSGTASAATQDQWDAVTIPEAGGDWYINHSGDGLSVGGLQFQNPSWHDALNYLQSQGVDTSGYPQDLYQGMPNVPTRTQQIMAGEALLHIQGPGAWANGNGVSLGASMFDGGANPFPDGTPHDLGPGTNDRGPADVPAPKTPKAPADSTSAGTYTVVSGDTLYGISIAKGLGDGGLKTWQPLYDANKDIVGSDPDLIFPGQVLRIPGDPVTEPAQTPPPAPASADWVRPVPGGVSQPFHNPGNYGLGYHTGVDFSASYGTPVHAVTSGTVVDGSSAGAAYGNFVVIEHAPGVFTLSAHLSEVDVSPGDHVAAGDVIGKVGSSGNSSGAHLHFELRNSPDQYGEGVFSDPVAWLAEHGVNL